MIPREEHESAEGNQLMFIIVITEKGGAKRRLEFDEESVTIGRVQGNQVVLPRGNVSKQHCRVENMAGDLSITDLGSTNGTYINGRRTVDSTTVRPGDKVYVGEFILNFEIPKTAPSASKPIAPAKPKLRR